MPVIYSLEIFRATAVLCALTFGVQLHNSRTKFLFLWT